MSSLIHLDGGSVTIDGITVDTRRAGCMARHGVAVIPEDRHDSGCVLDMTIAENLLIDRPGSVARFGFVNKARMRRRAEELMAEFEIKGAEPDAPMRSLSGGNQQRVVVARELSHRPKVLVAAQPTRGLDVGAIEYMSGRLRQAAADGVGILLISSELEEILDLADRILVMSDGQIIGEMARDEADLGRIGLMMGGQAA
jgi:simple sugar transport system ATP-binding protein